MCQCVSVSVGTIYDVDMNENFRASLFGAQVNFHFVTHQIPALSALRIFSGGPPKPIIYLYGVITHRTIDVTMGTMSLNVICDRCIFKPQIVWVYRHYVRSHFIVHLLTEDPHHHGVASSILYSTMCNTSHGIQHSFQSVSHGDNFLLFGLGESILPHSSYFFPQNLLCVLLLLPFHLLHSLLLVEMHTVHLLHDAHFAFLVSRRLK